MLCVELGNIELDLERLDKNINELIPARRNIREQKLTDIEKINDLYCLRELKETKKFNKAIGTLGGGNHFIELDKDNDGFIWLVIHTGSRHLGIEVCNWYQKQAYTRLKEVINGGTMAMKRLELINKLKSEGRQQSIDRYLKEFDRNYREKEPNISYEFYYCTDELFDMYIHDMEIVQQYASINRHEIAKLIL